MALLRALPPAAEMLVHHPKGAGRLLRYEGSDPHVHGRRRGRGNCKSAVPDNCPAALWPAVVRGAAGAADQGTGETVADSGGRNQTAWAEQANRRRRGPMAKRSIAVLGGGHGARTVAADLALAGHRVALFEMESFRGNMAAIFDRGSIDTSGLARNGTAITWCWCRARAAAWNSSRRFASSGIDYWQTGRTLAKCGIASMNRESLRQYAMTGTP